MKKIVTSSILKHRQSSTTIIFLALIDLLSALVIILLPFKQFVWWAKFKKSNWYILNRRPFLFLYLNKSYLLGAPPGLTPPRPPFALSGTSKFSYFLMWISMSGIKKFNKFLNTLKSFQHSWKTGAHEPFGELSKKSFLTHNSRRINYHYIRVVIVAKFFSGPNNRFRVPISHFVNFW